MQLAETSCELSNKRLTFLTISYFVASTGVRCFWYLQITEYSIIQLSFLYFLIYINTCLVSHLSSLKVRHSQIVAYRGSL